LIHGEDMDNLQSGTFLGHSVKLRRDVRVTSLKWNELTRFSFWQTDQWREPSYLCRATIFFSFVYFAGNSIWII